MKDHFCFVCSFCELGPEGPWNLLHVVAFRLKEKKKPF